MNILYYITIWDVGSSYKNINFMCDNFGGYIVQESVAKAVQYIHKDKPKFMIVLGDGRTNHRIALEYKLPYILIENDVSSMRRELSPKNREEEKTAIENATAIILTSEDHADYLKTQYKMPYYKVIHIRPLKKDLNFQPKPKTDYPSLVYAGGIANEDGRTSSFGYRCYHKIFKAFIEAGWEVHVYPAMPYNLSEYKNLGCIVHEKIPYSELLREMSQYTAGFQGYNKEGVPEQAYNYTQTCRPNKLWDYLAAGIPTIGYQGGRGMDIYRNKWGMVIKNLSKENLSKLPERLKKIKITDEMRYENTMDNDLEAYNEIVEFVLREAEVRKSMPTTVIPQTLNWDKDDMVIQVTNNRPQVIVRGDRVFQPYETTEPFVVTKSQWKEIKAHVGLKILYLQGG